MTQQEFTDRTKVQVSYNEFTAIHEVYMNSDLNKDDFCRIWVKMNKSRVIEARNKAAEEQKEQILKGMAWALYQRISAQNDTHLKLAYASLPRKDYNLLKGLNIQIEENMTLTTVWYNLGKYLGIVR